VVLIDGHFGIEPVEWTVGRRLFWVPLVQEK